jgi:meso-butanediol dehydrogenase / (S,S)-butanediol dehydrogenase / diacetyl reductase
MKNKVAIVTGGGSGIGQATVRRFIKEGARVVVADRANVDSVDAPGATDDNALAVAVDVGDERQVSGLMERTLGAFGRLDVLVNCAGIGTPRPITVPDATLAEFDELIRVNLKGTFLCCRAAIPLMRRAGGGAIVNIASELALIGRANTTMYTTTKAAILQLTRGLAVDHAVDNIRVNCICPGPIDTPLLRRAFARAADPEAKRKREMEQTILGRLGLPEEIANVIHFVASDEASYMTGSIVVADGGVTAK